MRSYRLQDVPNFLLYEGLAYIIRHSHSPEYTGTFYRRTYAGEERIFATRKEIEQELERRKQEPIDLSIKCDMCGTLTDGRCMWEQEPIPICPVCYQLKLEALGRRKPSLVPGRSGGGSRTVFHYENDAKGAEEGAEEGEKPSETDEQTRRKQIADKLGVPLELLELNRYFDDEGRK